MAGNGAVAGSDSVRATVLAEHYQKTYELVLHFWERRNRQFVTLAAVLAVAAVGSILQDALIAAARIYLEGLLKDAKTDVKVVLQALPQAYSVLITFLLVSSFYLMANLYLQTSLIINYYGYLELLEQDLRNELSLHRDRVAFTREGAYYSTTGQRVSTIVRLFYKLVLFALLVLLFATRMLIDWPEDLAALLWLPSNHVLPWLGRNYLFVLDVLLCVLTMILFFAYAFLRGKPASTSVLSRNDGA
jgi:hypothetical protein